MPDREKSKKEGDIIAFFKHQIGETECVPDDFGVLIDKHDSEFYRLFSFLKIRTGPECLSDL